MSYGIGPMRPDYTPQLPPARPPREPADASARPDLDQVRRDYQVQQDDLVTWSPNLIGWIPGVPSQQVTATEAKLLDNLQAARGLVGLDTFRGIRDDALQTAQDRYPGATPVDGHLDAFRHAYWNALMVREYGEDFARDFATAHEGSADSADSEAMDLYNNEVGRRIALENPDASPAELADLVEQAVRNGEMVVIDGDGELAWSDQVEIGATGRADDPQGAGGAAPPDGDTYPDSGY